MSTEVQADKFQTSGDLANQLRFKANFDIGGDTPQIHFAWNKQDKSFNLTYQPDGTGASQVILATLNLPAMTLHLDPSITII